MALSELLIFIIRTAIRHTISYAYALIILLGRYRARTQIPPHGLRLNRDIKVENVHGDAERGAHVRNVYDASDGSLDRSAGQQKVYLLSRVACAV